MRIGYSQAFTVNTIVAYLLVLLGYLLALVAAGWRVQAQWLDSGPPRRTFPALTATAFTLFTVGIF